MLPLNFFVAHEWYCNETLVVVPKSYGITSLRCNFVYCDKQQLVHFSLLW